LVAAGARVKAIWLTHHHIDHIGGAQHLARRVGVPIAAHQLTAELLRGRVTVDVALADGDTAFLGGSPPRRLRCVHTPGHAAGHLCFLEEETGFLVAGDMVAAIGTILIDPDEGDMRAYLASLAAMKALAARRLLPAHGSVLPDPDACLDGYREHRLWRESRICQAMRQLGPASVSALLPRAYDDVSPVVYPLAKRSLMAHLLKLELDGAARCEGGEWRLLV
jgi:glyoxylase-like metal-dependent hydrolase (beta-lactamase superfamily II)